MERPNPQIAKTHSTKMIKLREPAKHHNLLLIHSYYGAYTNESEYIVVRYDIIWYGWDEMRKDDIEVILG